MPTATAPRRCVHLRDCASAGATPRLRRAPGSSRRARRHADQRQRTRQIIFNADTESLAHRQLPVARRSNSVSRWPSNTASMPFCSNSTPMPAAQAAGPGLHNPLSSAGGRPPHPASAANTNQREQMDRRAAYDAHPLRLRRLTVSEQHGPWRKDFRFPMSRTDQMDALAQPSAAAHLHHPKAQTASDRA